MKPEGVPQVGPREVGEAPAQGAVRVEPRDLLDPNVTAHQLLAHAHDDEIDLLVMGHYHKSLFERLFSGSKILPTLENINTPMLVIPIADD